MLTFWQMMRMMTRIGDLVLQMNWLPLVAVLCVTGAWWTAKPIIMGFKSKRPGFESIEGYAANIVQ